MSELISASKAREIVENGKYTNATKQWEEIKELIENTIKKGYMSVNYYESIEKCNKKKLEDLGYSVIQGSQYNEVYTLISWY